MGFGIVFETLSLFGHNSQNVFEIAYLYKLENLNVIVLKQLEWHGVVKVTHNTAC